MRPMIAKDIIFDLWEARLRLNDLILGHAPEADREKIRIRIASLEEDLSRLPAA